MHSCVNKRSKKTSGTFTKEITSPQTGNNDRHQEDDENNLLSIGDEDVAGSEGKNSQIAVYGLQHCQVPDVFKIPFIVSGYRRPGISFWDCVKSLFHFSNETINVWSHLVALILFILVNMTSLPTDDPFFLPLISFAVGISILYLTSSSAHLFNCMSANSHRICFFLDYAAIGFYTFTAGQAMFFYSRVAGASVCSFHNSLTIFQTVSCVFSFLLTTFCCVSSHPRFKNHKALLKVAIVMMNWVVITSPCTVRLFLFKNDPAYNYTSMIYFKRHMIFCGLGAVLYALRLPERLMIGIFDNFGQSHNLQHILVAMGIQQAFNTVQADLHARRTVLTARFASQPTLMNTVGLSMIVLMGHITIVMWFARKLLAKRKPKD